jgi:hypothetical protein
MKSAAQRLGPTKNMRTRVSRKICSPLHILQTLDFFDGLKAMAMTWILGLQSDLMNDIQIQFITPDSHLFALVQKCRGRPSFGAF